MGRKEVGQKALGHKEGGALQVRRAAAAGGGPHGPPPPLPPTRARTAAVSGARGAAQVADWYIFAVIAHKRFDD